MNGLRDKTAIVTGAATLIGADLVRAFAAAGTNVVMADINPADGESVAAEIGERAVFQHTDVTDDASIDACLKTATERFGGVDFLVNIASTYLDDGIATSRQDWLAALNVNLVGGAILIQKAAPLIAQRGGGAIVNYASISAKRAQPGRLVYSSSKAAIMQMTRSTALLLAPQNIRVNSVSPGWTWSNIIRDLSGGDRAKADRIGGRFHLPGRIGDASEVAQAVLFLCSDAASFINGEDIAVDGGYCAIGPEQTEDAVSKLAE